MVLNTLVHHPAVAHYLRFVATTVGRDKALRLLQYLARFLSWYFLRKGYNASTIAPWDAMKKNFGSVRKAMRIGKNIEHMKAATVVSTWSSFALPFYPSIFSRPGSARIPQLSRQLASPATNNVIGPRKQIPPPSLPLPYRRPSILLLRLPNSRHPGIPLHHQNRPSQRSQHRPSR
jgi:hypothetical protein